MHVVLCFLLIFIKCLLLTLAVFQKYKKVLLNIESFQRRPSIRASIFRGEKVELISTFLRNQSKCELLIRRNYFASWKSAFTQKYDYYLP